ncbi:hypothetical protein FHR81_001827 [Actinoalloteichus hoggarensis]|uniref:Uncharacterized protein n=1 Tax=Actinoalloteichus hoggarensis TaxID=1470176 RepID=A0A221W5T2_9PSEU|nr:hypothetical protein AHOG_16155 [Actinoalloteichus hoggarensis]MBB5920789.1 hypothetical protein [Actinoalloteichus hoggarensis]
MSVISAAASPPRPRLAAHGRAIAQPLAEAVAAVPIDVAGAAIRITISTDRPAERACHDLGDDPLASGRQVCFALSVASRSVIGVYRPLSEPLGLAHPRCLVMRSERPDPAGAGTHPPDDRIGRMPVGTIRRLGRRIGVATGGGGGTMPVIVDGKIRTRPVPTFDDG